MSAPGIAVLRSALAAAAVLCAIGPSAAQDRPEPGSSSPSYESSVNLVLVDMRIRRGRDAVPDLRADEVTLLVDGKPRLITSLIYAPVVIAGEDGRVTAPGTAMPANAAATPIPARRFVFVVDRESLESGEARQFQKSTEEFIRRLPAAVGVAVTTLPLGSGIRFEPDRSATILSLREAFKGTRRRGADIEGIAGFGCEGAAASAGCGNQGIHPSIPVGPAREANLAAEWTLRGRKMLDDLKWIFRALADGLADVVVVSGALPFYDSARQGLRADIERAFTVAQTAGVRVHAVEVTERSRVPLPDGAGPPTLRLESLREKRPAAYGLPEETGGVQVVGAVSGADFFKQLSRELSSTYLLSFEPTDADRDGKPHTIEVRISRTPKLTVHARKSFVASAVTTPPPPPVAAASRSVPAAPIPAPGPAGEASASVATAEAAIPLLTVMQRASAYIDAFERTLSSLVVEERYVQIVKLWFGDPPKPGQEPALAWQAGKGEQRSRSATFAVRRRQLLSDVLLVQQPGQIWIGYRDVAEVDGKPVRDRAVRIQKLFLSGTTNARAQLQRIVDDSARHNLGSSRNVNMPTFPLQILRPANLARFEWTTTSQKRSPTDPPACTVVGFRETAAPTIVRTDKGRNVPMTGQFCIEPENGRVWRATLNFKESVENVEGSFEVIFRPTSDLSVLIPDRAWEWSLSQDPGLEPAKPLFVEGQATYLNTRRFSVTTEEVLR
jgi:VWFA-related protein